MELVLTYLDRLRHMRLARMKMYIRQVHQECGKPGAVVFLDMVWCFFRYGIGYLEYRTFGFAYQDGAHRRTYMTMRDNHRLCRRLNDPQKRKVLENKIEFLTAFNPYTGREWKDLGACGPAAFTLFVRRHGSIFAKTPDGFGGLGVERIDCANVDAAKLYERLVRQGKTLVEQPIEQHSRLAALCPRSINTLRVATIVKEGQVHILYVILRIGSGNSEVDNITSGGMYAPVGPDGIVRAAAFCDKTGQYYERHPLTGVQIQGFEIPLFREAMQLVRQAALVEPSVRYVGWDIAVTPSGPVLVEGNTLPGFYIRQNYRHLGADKLGAKPDFVEVLKDEF